MPGARRLRREDGASAVEFALILSVLFMLVFGTIQFGITYNRYQGLQAGSREGARLGSLQGTTIENIIDRVRQSVSIIAGTSLTYSTTCPTGLGLNQGCIRVSRRNASSGAVTVLSGLATQPCNLQTGNTVIVETSYRVRIEIPPVMFFPLTISASGEFRCE